MAAKRKVAKKAAAKKTASKPKPRPPARAASESGPPRTVQYSDLRKVLLDSVLKRLR